MAKSGTSSYCTKRNSQSTASVPRFPSSAFFSYFSIGAFKLWTEMEKRPRWGGWQFAADIRQDAPSCGLLATIRCHATDSLSSRNKTLNHVLQPLPTSRHRRLGFYPCCRNSDRSSHGLMVCAPVQASASERQSSNQFCSDHSFVVPPYEELPDQPAISNILMPMLFWEVPL